jgi:hypothetical protein
MPESDQGPRTEKRAEIPSRPLFEGGFLAPRAPVSCAFFCPKMILTLVLAALDVEVSLRELSRWHVVEEAVYVAPLN